MPFGKLPVAFFDLGKDSIKMTEAEKEKYKAYDRMMRAVPNVGIIGQE